MSFAAIPGWIHDHYVLVDRLGGGYWSDVYRIKDRSTGNTLAVKILKPEFRSDPQTRSRFLTEARAMARIVHPNIVRIFDMGGALSEEPAIVMEFCEGGDLRKFVERRPMEADEVAKMSIFVILGLLAAHKAGVIHRGLCPESIFLDRENKPKVADFGVALVAQNPHLPTLIDEELGEYWYSAPEQRNNAHAVDVRSDVYAMGALVWYMSHRKDPPDLAQASRNPKLVDGLDPALRPIVTKACMARPDQRYPTVREMGQDLRKLFT